MKEYACYMSFDGLDEGAHQAITELAKAFSLSVQLGARSLEFDYAGTDASSRVIRFFYELAKIIKNADGELVCQLIDDELNDEFAFYQIASGKLLHQPGKIVRGAKAVVEL